MKRQANIELLRGILMLMIVLVHLTGNGVLSDTDPINFAETNWIMANIIDAICYPAVNCFILISGYFGIKPTIKKFLNLEIPVIVYGIIAYVLFDRNSFGGAIHAVLPVLSKSYWFFTSYFMLLLAAPFLNDFVDKASRKNHRIAVLIALLFFVLIPSFSPFRLSEARGMDFVFFSVLYLIGRYLGKYNLHLSLKHSMLTYTFTTILCFSLTMILAYQFGINRGWKSPFYAYNNILVLLQSIGLFYIFKNIKVDEKWDRVINYLSPSFFFTYIIHENPKVHFLLYGWIGSESVYYSTNFILHTIGWSMVIFITCILIDIVIRRLIFLKIIDNNVNMLDKVLNSFLNRLNHLEI